MKIAFPKFLPAIGMFLLLTFLLTIPGQELPKVGAWFDLFSVDKFIHIGLFGALVYWWCWPFNRSNMAIFQRRKRFFRVAIMAVIYGIAMEFVQKYWIPNRSCDVSDMIADAIGAFGGYWWARKFFVK